MSQPNETIPVIELCNLGHHYFRGTIKGVEQPQRCVHCLVIGRERLDAENAAAQQEIDQLRKARIDDGEKCLTWDAEVQRLKASITQQVLAEREACAKMLIAEAEVRDTDYELRTPLAALAHRIRQRPTPGA